MARVLVGMSGGVDSSVAAALMVREGHEVIGVSLQLFDHSHGGRATRCCSPEDFLDARRVSEKLGIRYYVVNREESFGREVLDNFVDEYRQGRTPNPCVRCNAEVKFETLMRLADDLSASHVATGHYARLVDRPGGDRGLLRARDHEKDQSYFLFDLTPGQRRVALFPLGEMTKEQVREIAQDLDPITAAKPESQDVCFVEQGDYRSFVKGRMAETGMTESPGLITDRAGVHLGAHEGVSGFTIGQRRGLGVSAGRRLYVIGIEAGENRVVLGDENDLMHDSLVLERTRFLEDSPDASFECQVHVRYRHGGAPARVIPSGDGSATVRFHEPVRGAAPGQAAVFYDDERVVGGGWIRRVGEESRRTAVSTA